MRELVIVRNPDPNSRLPFLMRVPLSPESMLLRVGGTWPRERAIFCYPADESEWPDEPEVVEKVNVRSCVRRGASIDLVLDRGRENRSQIVFTTARGRPAIFWQTARVRKQARPNVRTPTARASGLAELEIIVDDRERYGYRFRNQQVQLSKRRLPAGDYAIENGGRIHAAVERKSIADLTSSLTGGKLRYQVSELAEIPHAAIVVEDRYSQIFKHEYVRPAVMLDGLAELQIAYPTVPLVFCETRALAEEYTYRFLAAAYAAAPEEAPAADAEQPAEAVKRPALSHASASTDPKPAEVRAWARANGVAVPDRGRLPPAITAAYRREHTQDRAPRGL